MKKETVMKTKYSEIFIWSRFLFDPEKDHYKLEKAVSPCNNNYVQYEGIGHKDKSLDNILILSDHILVI